MSTPPTSLRQNDGVISPANEAEGGAVSGRELAALLAIAFIAYFLRSPRILLHGRLLTEEGTTYLRYAWDVRPLWALLAPHQGYYSLLPNLVSLASARIFPLQYAGLLFAWAGLLNQLVVVLVLVTLEVFRTPRARQLVLITFLLATPSTQPVLNSICAQFFLAFGTAALLVSRPQHWPRLRCAFLLFAGLNGPTSSTLAPFYWVRAMRLRSRQCVIQAAILSCSALLQGALLLASLHHASRALQPRAWKMLGPVLFQRMLFQPWFTGHVTGIYDHFLWTHFTIRWLATFTVLASLGVAALLLTARRTGSTAVWLTVAAFWFFFFHWYGTLGSDINNLTPAGEERYWFPGNALLAIALLLCAQTQTAPLALRRISTVLLLLGWCNGLIAYRSGWSNLHDYPSWQKQVEAWKHDPSLELQAAPTAWSLRIRLTSQPQNLSLPVDAYDSSNPHRLH
jgi:hypothetical protein